MMLLRHFLLGWNQLLYFKCVVDFAMFGVFGHSLPVKYIFIVIDVVLILLLVLKLGGKFCSNFPSNIRIDLQKEKIKIYRKLDHPSGVRKFIF